MLHQNDVHNQNKTTDQALEKRISFLASRTNIGQVRIRSCVPFDSEKKMMWSRDMLCYQLRK